MPQPIYVFKVALSERKSVWRRIGVKANQTLDDLHEAIYGAFDRDDEHLYSFYIPKPGGRNRSLRLIVRDAKEYTHPYAFKGDSVFATDAANAAETTIASLNLAPKRKFYYLFDFGDEWWHEITLESIDGQSKDRARYPRVLEAKGKSPPQYPDFEDDEE
jgi:hypothetical protein